MGRLGAQLWNVLSVTDDDAVVASFLAIGFPSRESCQEWIDDGFSAEEAAGWTLVYDEYVGGLSAACWEDHLACEYLSLGFTAAEALKWVDVWRETHGGPPDVSDWRDAGFEPEEALEWLAESSGWQDQTELAYTWARAGVEPDEAWQWVNAAPGITPAERDHWDKAGVYSFTRVGRYRAAGISPDEFTEWGRHQADIFAALALGSAT